MTLSELLDCDAATLKAMSDEELTKHFSAYFNVTRPELAPKVARSGATIAPVDFATKQKMQKLAELGIDVSGIFKKKKK